MFSIKLGQCKINVVPFEEVQHVGEKHIYDVSRPVDIERVLRILIFCGEKEIFIHTKTHESKQEWTYALHTLYTGRYALAFEDKNCKKNLIDSRHAR